MCRECYTEHSRITPLFNPLDCLRNHTQYICGTCGRCICIEHDPQRGLQRLHFPFKSVEIAKLYLRTADYENKKPCGIYELRNTKGRLSYKIFPERQDLEIYLRKNKDKSCETMNAADTAGEYREFPDTQVRRLTEGEIEWYMSERH